MKSNLISGVEMHARDYDAYARRKRNVCSLDLNVTNDKLFLMSIGIVVLCHVTIFYER